ncbi:MAG: serine/threonine-protein kinase, partial [Gemmatimonadota bacterium]
MSRPTGEGPSVLEAFSRALDHPPGERSAYLDRAVGRDGPIRAEVEGLLAALDTTPDYLEGLAERLLPGILEFLPDDLPGPGDRVDSYELIRPLGAGGMGVVYLARDLDLDRSVALKLLPPHATGDDGAQRRLIREARAASSLDHPHIGVIYRVGLSQGSRPRPYIAMAHYEGETLREKISRGPLPLDRVLEWGIQMARGLGRAHEAGIVHRDVKAANIIVTRRGQIRILDFGVARLAEDGMEDSPAAGTPGAMSPEQTRGEEVDGRSDLWSLGVLLYEMVSGVPPFTGRDRQGLIRSIREEEPPPLESLRPETPPLLSRVVRRCLAKRPGDRYAVAEEVVTELALALATEAEGLKGVDVRGRPGVAV